MPFYDYLKIPSVIELKSPEKADALEQLTQSLCRELGLRKFRPIAEEIHRREESASTFIGQGVALPQARAAISDEFAIAVGRSVSGIKYDAARGALAHIIVLILIRNDADNARQVQLLSELATFFKSTQVRDKILALEGPIDLRTVISAYTKAGKEEKRKSRSTRKGVNPTIGAAMGIFRETKADALMVFADAVRDSDFLEHTRTRGKLLVVTSNKSRFTRQDRRIKAVIQAPSFPTSRTGQMKIGVLLALSRNLISKDSRVVCLSGNPKFGVGFDTIVALNVASEYEFFFTDAPNILPADVKPEVLERVLGLAGEIAVEGREGKPTGTIFVVGDTNSVNAYVRQLIINPFRGYSEAERNVLDPGLDETIKEFAGIDGAFVVTGDGTVLSAGSYLRPQAAEVESLPSGFGARHAAAAGITACTKALAITISESTGMVTLFRDGKIMMTLSRPVVQDKSMIQKIL